MTNRDLDLRDPEWLAAQLGIEKNTIYKYLNDGMLPGLKLGRKWLVSQADLTSFLTQERVKQTRQRRAERWVVEQIAQIDGELLMADGPDEAVLLVRPIASALMWQLENRGFLMGANIPDVEDAARQMRASVGRCDRCDKNLVLWTKASFEGDESPPWCESCVDELVNDHLEAQAAGNASPPPDVGSQRRKGGVAES